MLITLFSLAALGLAISLYTYRTEQKIKKDSSFKPACDISDRISCSKPMLSPYANIFFFSNATIGIVYYALIGILAYFNYVHVILLAAVGSCLASCFLAYLLYFKIRTLCILCTSLYVVNFLILVAAYIAM
jgi:vitamin-K-epoxide reductase (warfarin-sensitive)